MTWPVRTRICLECRAALSDGEDCTWVRHTAVAPADPAQQRQLEVAVWRSDWQRPPPVRLTDAIARFLRQLDWGMTPGGSPVLDVPPAPRYRSDSWLRVHGASEEPLWTARTRYRGRVTGDAATAPSPIAGAQCVAYGLWLLDPGASESPVLLRDGASLGFDVALEDGRVARIPAGTADLVAPGVRVRRSHPRLKIYLRHLDPEAPRRRAPSPLPYREAREALLRPGDALTLLADLQPVPDPRRAAGSAYRVAVASVLVPVGRIAIETGAAARP